MTTYFLWTISKNIQQNFSEKIRCHSLLFGLQVELQFSTCLNDFSHIGCMAGLYTYNLFVDLLDGKNKDAMQHIVSYEDIQR